jgi:uncharacterized membrane-anchored protein
MIWQTERVLKMGTAYRFLLQPIDPYDAFRGRYIILNYNNPLLPVRDSMNAAQDVYVTLGEDSLGFSRFESVLTSPPEHQDYLHTQVDYYTHGKIQVMIPENIRYYYANEKTAPEIEKYTSRPRQADSIENRAYALIRIRKGEAVVEELYINDLPVKEFLSK